MNTQARPKSMAFPINKRIRGRNDQTSSSVFVHIKKCKFLLALTVLTWIVAAFVSVAFYIDVRSNRAEADWLACILMGMVFLGWIMLASYFRAAGKPIRSTGKRERNDPHRPAPTSTSARKE